MTKDYPPMSWHREESIQFSFIERHGPFPIDDEEREAWDSLWELENFNGVLFADSIDAPCEIPAGSMKSDNFGLGFTRASMVRRGEVQ